MPVGQESVPCGITVPRSFLTRYTACHLQINLLINTILQESKFLLLQSKTTVKTTVVCIKIQQLNIETEQNNIAVLHHILLALAAEQPFLLGGVDAAAGDHVLIGDDLRPDEAPLDIGVDLARRLRALVPLRMVHARHSSLP